MERLLCTLLPAEGTIASWRGCFTWVQRSSRTTGEGHHFMMLQRTESWRLDATFVNVFVLSCLNTMNCIHKAVSFSNILFCSFFQCCKILLANQANPSDHDIDGFTAANLAEYNGHQECARYLRAVERNVSSLLLTCSIFYFAHFPALCPFVVSALPSCLLWHENQS